MINPVQDVKNRKYRVKTICRGGGWTGVELYMRMSDHRYYYPNNEYEHLGFRVVRGKE